MSIVSSLRAGIKTTDGVNYLNIFLMLFSCAVAYLIPFELFLFAYSVIGPLHYLTEISWLQKKNYFIKSKKDIWLFVLVSVLLLVALLDKNSKINQITTGLIFTSFMFAFIILFIEKTTQKLFWLFLVFFLFAVFGLNNVWAFQVIFAILLPTIVHVFIFTGAFILYGALKSKSISGIFSLFVFIACALICFFFDLENIAYSVSAYVRKTYEMFFIINKTLSDVLGVGSIRKANDIFNNAGAIAVMRFIAFAYTYHYLNWFSKTSIIKWHEISKKRMISIVFLWIVSVVLYAYNYTVGFFALFFLSLLHVFLEFPLNHHTFIGIGKEFKLIFKRAE